MSNKQETLLAEIRNHENKFTNVIFVWDILSKKTKAID